MRWMWIDRIVEFEPRSRMVAVKNVSLAEEHLHDHFPAEASRNQGIKASSAATLDASMPQCLDALPVMPASLMIEGMAQTAGILVGSVHNFREKVILAKVVTARFDRDVFPGQTIRYEAALDRIDTSGAATSGVVKLLDHARVACYGEAEARGVDLYETIGRVDLMFSHIDRNMAGLAFPEENFVFSENFKTILRSAGLEHLAQ